MINAIILAAGKGTRMKSDLPKVLHPVLEVPMIQYVIDHLKAAGVDRCIAVIGHQACQVEEYLQDQVEYVYQLEQKGTGHAVMQAKSLLKDVVGTTLIVCGDTPLTSATTFASLIKQHQDEQNQATVLSAIEDNPTGYGRIIRNDTGHVCAIIEEKDADVNQKAVKEINVGTYCFDNQLLMKALDEIQPNNAQNEYYLTDVISILEKQKHKVGSFVLANKEESIGVNDKLTLAKVSKIMQRIINENHMLNGVSMIDPETTYIGKYVEIAPEVTIYPGTMIFGESNIGYGTNIGPMNTLRNVEIGENVSIEHAHVDHCVIEDNVHIGPYVRLRNNCVIKEGSSMGNFVEMKNVQYGKKSRCAHLTYLGDTIVGEDVNIGCGTVTVNYDGFNKFKTIIGDRSFIGCNTNLVAPVTVSADTIIAAGSTITADVPDFAMGIARVRQVNKENYVQAYREKRKK